MPPFNSRYPIKASISLLKTRHSLLETLATEASNPSPNQKHYRFYPFPHHIQLGVLERHIRTQAYPAVPLIDAQIRTNRAGLANHPASGKKPLHLVT